MKVNLQEKSSIMSASFKFRKNLLGIGETISDPGISKKAKDFKEKYAALALADTTNKIRRRKLIGGAPLDSKILAEQEKKAAIERAELNAALRDFMEDVLVHLMPNRGPTTSETFEDYLNSYESSD